MRAAVYVGNQQVDVVDVAEPTLQAGQVKIKVAYNGICGSDLHEYFDGPLFIPVQPHALTGQQLPMVLGHEFSGVIVDVGADVTGFGEGERVVVEPIYRCGQCAPCRAGNYNACRQIGFHGLMADGGMAEYTVVPVGMVHKLPDEVSLELGALVEPMAVAYHAARFGEVSAGSSVVILGAGPIGIGLWFALTGMGVEVERITVVEPSAERRAAIANLGARVLDPTVDEVVSTVLAATGGDGADAVFDAAGAPSAVATGLACIGARAPFVAVAVYERPIETPLVNLILTEARIQGSLGYTSRDFADVIALMAKGHYDTTGWVSTIAIGDVVGEGFDALTAGTKMKVLVDPTT